MRPITTLLLLLSTFPLYSQTAPAVHRRTTVQSVSLSNDSIVSSENFQQVVRDIQNNVYITRTESLIADIARGTMHNHGYFKAEVDSVSTQVLNETTKTRTIAVTLGIREGEQYRVSHITFAKDREFSEAQLRQAFPVHDGDVMSNEKISEGVESIRKLFATKGYMEGGAFPKEMAADDASRTVAIIMDVHEGPQFTLLGLTLDEGPQEMVNGVMGKGRPWPTDKAAKLQALSGPYQGTHNVGVFIEAVKQTLGEMFPGCYLDSLVGTIQGGDPPHATINVIYPSPEDCQAN